MKERGPLLRWGLHVALGALGTTAVVLLVRHVGARELGAVLLELAPFLAVAFAIEGARIGIDALRAQLLLARAGAVVGFGRLARLHVAAYPVSLLVPAGGAAGEIYKAIILAEEVGAPAAAAAGALQPGIALLGGFVIALPCLAAAALVWGWSGFTVAIAVQGATALGIGLGILLGARQRAVGRVAGKLSAKTGAAIDQVQRVIEGLPVVPLGALGAAVVSRVLQLALVGVLAWGAGASPGLRSALLALGVQLVGAAAGDLVPAQIGATDASFVLAAAPLGIDAAHAVSIAIAGHVVQLAWALVGGLLAPRWSRQRPP